MRRRLAHLAVLWSVVVPLAAAAAPKGHCSRLKGVILTQQSTALCPSPLGLCFDGRLHATAGLVGRTFFVVETIEAVPSDPNLLVYTGTLTVSLVSGGTITFDSQGLVDTTSGAFSELDVPTQSSGFTGVVFITGTTTPTLSSFAGSISGSLCGGAIAKVAR
jgi:hypothetical protein